MKSIGIYAALSRGRLRAARAACSETSDDDAARALGRRSGAQLAPSSARSADTALRGFAKRRHAASRRGASSVLAVACLPLAIQDVYLQNVLVLTLMYAALSQSWNILGGYCGQISLGHALYFGIGAYVIDAPLCAMPASRPGSACWLGGALAALDRARARLSASSGSRGHYFTIATIVIAEAGLLLVHQLGFCGRRRRASSGPYGPDSWATSAIRARQAPLHLFRARLCGRHLARHLPDRGFALGLLVARREGQCRRRRKPRRRWSSARRWRRPRSRPSSRRSAAASMRLSSPISIPTA